MRRGAGDPGVVDEDVDAAHGVHRGLEQQIDLGGIGDIGQGRADRSTPHVLDQSRLNVAGEDRSAVGRQRLRDDTPNPRSAGGDHRAPALTQNFHGPLPLFSVAPD